MNSPLCKSSYFHLQRSFVRVTVALPYTFITLSDIEECWKTLKKKSQYFFLKAHCKSGKTQLWISWVELMSTITVSKDLPFTPSSVLD